MSYVFFLNRYNTAVIEARTRERQKSIKKPKVHQHAQVRSKFSKPNTSEGSSESEESSDANDALESAIKAPEAPKILAADA